MKKDQKYTFRGIAIAIIGMFASFFGSIYALGIASADNGTVANNDLGIILIVGGAVLIVGGIVAFALIRFVD